MSSSFWLDSDDEWEDDIYSSDEGSDRDDVKPISRFADIDMEEDEEDDKRVTRSAQEKSWDELHKSVKVLKTKMFINDWNTVSTGAYIACSTSFVWPPFDSRFLCFPCCHSDIALRNMILRLGFHTNLPISACWSRQKRGNWLRSPWPGKRVELFLLSSIARLS